MKRYITLIFALLFMHVAHATHNRAGEITFRHVSGLRYEITITTYTEVGNDQADRPFLPIDWGDNSGNDSIQRQPFPPRIGTVQQNIYVKTHVYPGPGTYLLSVEDPNRNRDVRNIPNSVAVPFYIETELIIDAFAGHNNSVDLLTPAIDYACVGGIFVHDPAAFDPDGDSLVFSLEESRGRDGSIAGGYFFPPAANKFEIDPRTGVVIWDAPASIGEFNFAIRVKEYNNGVLVGGVLRDMQIIVGPGCTHIPPAIQDLDDLCVEAGELFIFNVFANDTTDGSGSNDGDTVTLTATGGPLLIDNPATFDNVGVGNRVAGRFRWNTSCINVRKKPYRMVFRATDDGDPNLSSFKSVEIKIIAPAPENLAAEPDKNAIKLNWDRSDCFNAVGYKIYRRLGPSGFVPDECETGVPASAGYELIHTTESINDTNFVDDNNGKGLIFGRGEYCYRIIAFFEDGAESYASEEVCIQLKKELPIITKVTVDSTSLFSGRIEVEWTKPTEHDVSVYPGPYRYVIRSKIWNEDYIVIDSSEINIDDTTYNHEGLNTEENEYSYIIDMYDLSEGRTLMGSSVAASSIYLASLAQDNQLVLQWDEDVPWLNLNYVIYRRNPITLAFDSITTVSGNQYIDTKLANGVEQCYEIKSIGEYQVPGFVKPILNYSQIHCNTPVDITAPCPPVVQLETTSCQEVDDSETKNPNFNPCSEDEIEETLLRWTNPNNACDTTDDVVAYKVYYKAFQDAPFEVIYTTNNVSDTTYQHNIENSIAGCYYVTAVDSFQNESSFTDSVCVDNCPSYRLPNVFTPSNADGLNDLFQPFPYCFIESVRMQIFNRWGQLVFETTDPDINWDGVNQETGKDASEGVYYYVCELSEIRFAGTTRNVLKGFVHLYRNAGE